MKDRILELLKELFGTSDYVLLPRSRNAAMRELLRKWQSPDGE